MGFESPNANGGSLPFNPPGPATVGLPASSNRTGRIERLRRNVASIYTDAGVQAPRGAVVLMFWDGDAEDSSYTSGQLVARNLPGSFYPPYNYIGTGGKMTWSQVRALQDAGHEVGAETRNHTAVSDDATWVDEVETVLDDFATQTLYIQSGAQPGVWTGNYNLDNSAKVNDTLYEQVLQANYVGWDAYITDDQGSSSIRSFPNVRPIGGIHYTIEAGTVADIEAHVDAVIRQQGLIVFGAHSRNLGATNYISKADFQTALDYIQTKRDAGYIDVITYSAACAGRRHATIPNLWPDPTWDLSGAAGALYPAFSATGSPVIVNSGARTGTYALKVNSTNYVTYVLNAEAFRSGFFECWIASASAGVAATFNCTIRQVDANGATLATIINKNQASTDAYARFQTTFGAKPGTAYIAILILTGGANYALVDDVTVRKI